jgi:Sulfotransferase family
MSTPTAVVRRRPIARRVVGTGIVLASRLRPPGPFTVESVLDDARAKSGLEDPGPDHLWREGLEALLVALAEEARLTPAGRWFARGQLVDLLANRLRLQDAWRATPDLLDEPIHRPIVIIGLPRTGSTLLQHLLSLDDQNRSLRQWEAARPVPAPPAHDDDPRVSEAERAFRLLSVLEPEARALHPGSPTQPTECVTLLANSFASLELAAINRVPSYLQWCLERDLRAHYDDLRAQLQLLQANTPAAQWVLKCPAHLFALDALVAAFPTAVIVQTHRHPAEVLPSYCHLLATLQGIGSRRVDEQEIADTWTAAWADGLDRSADIVARHPDIEIEDVDYQDLIRAPMDVIGRIYDRAGRSLGRNGEATMRAYLADPGRLVRPRPTRPLDRFKIDLDAHPAYERYLAARGGLSAQGTS